MNNLNSPVSLESLVSKLENFFTSNPADKQKKDYRLITRRMRDLFKENSQVFIQDIVDNPQHNETYLKLKQHLERTDDGLLREMTPLFSLIQQFNLQKKCNSEPFTRKEQPSHCKTVASESKKLNAPAIEGQRVFHRGDPFCALVQRINCNQTPLNSLKISREDLLLLAPHLTYIDCREIFNECPVETLEEFLRACSSKNIDTLLIKSERLEWLPPDLSSCKVLNCSECPALKQLPPLPQCKTLNCSFCCGLEQLPDLPDCEELDCSFCASLQKLPNLLQCRKLICWGCHNLERFPFLPKCQQFNYTGCIKASHSIHPRLLQSYGQEEINKCCIEIKDINDNPLKVLFDLGPRVLHGYRLSPIRIINEDGFDVSGIKKEKFLKSFISNLMNSIARHAESEGQLHFIKNKNGLLMPFIDSLAGNIEDQIKGFQILGAIFVRCIKEGYLTGNVFDPNFFRLLSIFSYDIFRNIAEGAKEIPDYIRWYLKLIEKKMKNKSKVIDLLRVNPSSLSEEDCSFLESVIVTFDKEHRDLQTIFPNKEENIQKKLKEILSTKDQRCDIPHAFTLIGKQMHALLKYRDTWDSLCKHNWAELQKTKKTK